jgi:hypothetical protein
MEGNMHQISSISTPFYRIPNALSEWPFGPLLWKVAFYSDQKVPFMVSPFLRWPESPFYGLTKSLFMESPFYGSRSKSDFILSCKWE